jgi:hypothetical protein
MVQRLAPTPLAIYKGAGFSFFFCSDEKLELNLQGFKQNKQFTPNYFWFNPAPARLFFDIVQVETQVGEGGCKQSYTCI